MLGGWLAIALFCFQLVRHVLGWIIAGTTLIFSYLIAARMLTWWYTQVVVPHGWLVLTPVCGYLAIATCLASLSLLWREATGVRLDSVKEQIKKIEARRPPRVALKASTQRNRLHAETGGWRRHRDYEHPCSRRF